MRILLLFPKVYTLANTFKLGLEKNNCDYKHYDYREDTKKTQERIHTHIRKFPLKIRSKWYAYYVSKINERHIEIFNEYQPNVVLIYNSEMLLPETIVAMKRSAKVCFFLGDSPFYTPMNDFFLPCLMVADYIFCPDSFIVKQLKGIGLPEVHFFLIGSNPEVNYRKKVSEEDKEKWGSDLVFIGSTYSTVVGYKRALFLSKFTDLDIKVYTSKAFRRWYRFFPELEKRVVHPEKRISDEELNTILNCCKIYPVDANPGLLNGIHLRVFDCIASGILPLAEYRKDIKDVFGQEGLPLIEDYKKASSMAEYYLKNEDERREIVEKLREKVYEQFSPEKSVQRLFDTSRL